MSRPRLDVQNQLEEAMLKVGYEPHVYYQSPGLTGLVYPCIVYNRENFDTIHANNHIYKDMTRYTLTVIDKHPLSPLVDVLRNFDYCEMNNELVAENLHHFVFTYFY